MRLDLDSQIITKQLSSNFSYRCPPVDDKNDQSNFHYGEYEFDWEHLGTLNEGSKKKIKLFSKAHYSDDEEITLDVIFHAQGHFRTGSYIC